MIFIVLDVRLGQKNCAERLKSSLQKFNGRHGFVVFSFFYHLTMTGLFIKNPVDDGWSLLTEFAFLDGALSYFKIILIHL